MDAIGQILKAYLREGSAGDMLQIERDDGFITYTSLEPWVNIEHGLPAMDSYLLSFLSKGSVLDVACGTGRHLKPLLDRGFLPFGIDISSEVVSNVFPSLRGYVRTSSFWDYKPDQCFDNIIIMDSSIGLIERIVNLHPFLVRIAGMLNSGGLVGLSSVDWRNPSHEVHRCYQLASTQSYKGEVQLRLRYRGIEGGFFKWVWIDPDTLLKAALETGFTVIDLKRHGAKYTAILKWHPESSNCINEDSEYLLEDTKLIDGLDTRQVSFGNRSHCRDVRVSQFGPFRLSFHVTTAQARRSEVVKCRPFLRVMHDLLKLPILIGGSMSPLSRKLPTRESDFDFYIPIYDAMARGDVETLLKKIESMDYHSVPLRATDFSLILPSWLNLPYFCEAVDPLDEGSWNTWVGSPVIARLEYQQRLETSLFYLRSIDTAEIADEIQNYFGIQIDTSHVFRVIATPRWKSLGDSNIRRLMNLALDQHHE